MVKVQDGQQILGSQALGGGAEDDEGKPLKFEQVQTGTGGVPTWTAKANMNDGSGRTRFYTFGLADTNVRVSIITKTPEEIKAEEQATVAAKKEADEAAAKTRKETLSATQQQKQEEPQPPKTEKAFKTVSSQKNNKK